MYAEFENDVIATSTPYSSTIFTILNFQDWSNNGAFSDGCHGLGFRIRSHKGVIVHHLSSPFGRILYWFPAVARCRKYFFDNCVSCILLAGSSKRKTLSSILFRVACVGGDTKSCTSSGFNLVNFLLSTRTATSPFSSSVEPN